MKIGFDLDNTLVDYSDSVKVYVKNFQDCDAKTVPQLRNWFRAQNQDELWTKAQSWLYSEGLEYAKISDGALEILIAVAELSIDFSILSHKTLLGPQRYGRKEFRKLMNEWLFCSDLWNICTNKIEYFDSLDEKIEGIRKGNFDFFVDDLRKVLEHKRFPDRTMPVLYSPEKLNFETGTTSAVIIIDSFTSLMELLTL